MKILTTVSIFLVAILIGLCMNCHAAELNLGHTYLNASESVLYRVENDGRFYYSPAGPYVGRIDSEGRVYNRKGAFINRIKLISPQYIGPTLISTESGQYSCI